MCQIAELLHSHAAAVGGVCKAWLSQEPICQMLHQNVLLLVCQMQISKALAASRVLRCCLLQLLIPCCHTVGLLLSQGGTFCGLQGSLGVHMM